MCPGWLAELSLTSSLQGTRRKQECWWGFCCLTDSDCAPFGLWGRPSCLVRRVDNSEIGRKHHKERGGRVRNGENSLNHEICSYLYLSRKRAVAMTTSGPAVSGHEFQGLGGCRENREERDWRNNRSTKNTIDQQCARSDTPEVFNGAMDIYCTLNTWLS